MATVRTAATLGHSPWSDDARDRAKVERDAVEVTAESLGNTPTVCRASYVHPVVLDAYDDGELGPWWAERAPRSPARLTADERRVVALLRASTSASRRRAAEALVELPAA
jgi:DNA topoisomerase IB